MRKELRVEDTTFDGHLRMAGFRSMGRCTLPRRFARDTIAITSTKPGDRARGSTIEKSILRVKERALNLPKREQVNGCLVVLRVEVR